MRNDLRRTLDLAIDTVLGGLTKEFCRRVTPGAVFTHGIDDWVTCTCICMCAWFENSPVVGNQASYNNCVT
jgi:hypothetical protein